MESSENQLKNLSQFIVEHYGDDPQRLALQKDKWPGVDVAAAVSTLLSRRKLSGKAPLWATTPGLVLPRELSAEQCSGSVTARHKAKVIADIFDKPRIADLTGGLGVDSLEFSRVAEKVFYNEMNPSLAEAARHNFEIFGAWNIEVHCFEATVETLPFCKDFRPDVVFLDPARRDGCGNKVFLLEDCSPDVLKMKEALLALAPVVILKLSPMADISMIIKRLGEEYCSQVQILEAGGECKELLVVLRREKTQEGCLIKAYNLDWSDNPVLEYRLGCSSGAASGDSRVVAPDGKTSALRFAEEGEIVSGEVLFEPGKALMKAGCFSLIGEKLCGAVFGRDTHYYIVKNYSPDAKEADARLDSLTGAGKCFRILEVATMSGKTVKEFGKSHPEAEVSARGVHITSEELRKRLGCRPSGRFHIFALHADSTGKNLLLFTERI